MVTTYSQLNTTGRDRLVVRTLRCGRSNPGSNPGHGIFILSLRGLWKLTRGEFHSTGVLAFNQHNANLVKNYKKVHASAGNRTRINCLEGSYADHYTTDAFLVVEAFFFIIDMLARLQSWW